MADDSIAVVDLDDCQPDRCNYECADFCPPNRSGKDCIVTREEHFDSGEDFDGKPEQVWISEDICLGESCGICVTKCPFDAIQIVNLPDELDESPAHRYGENAFSLYRLPAPQNGEVVGMLGPNGIGKTTAVRLLTGQLTPNLGAFDQQPELEDAIEQYRGTAVQQYLTALNDDDVSTALKPQYVRKIPQQYSGTVQGLLKQVDERDALNELVAQLSLEELLQQDISDLSGGELQRVAIVACLAKDADFYFLDELTPYLDISQRVAAARAVRTIVEDSERAALVVEHDLAVLDLLCDTVHVGYGSSGAFGILSPPIPTRTAINEYLEGYVQSENTRIRPESITFTEHAPRSATERDTLLTYPSFTKSYGEDSFTLDAEGGEIISGEVLGIVGPNGIGKSTFAKVLAGELDADDGALDIDATVSYKPQYVDTDQYMRVDALLRSTTDDFGSSIWNSQIAEPLDLSDLYEQEMNTLSGGERQRVAIAEALSRDADLYLFDEPSAHLDVERRVQVARTIRQHAEGTDSTMLVIDHDVYSIDLLSDRLLVFDGEPAVSGHAATPQSMRQGMNTFLKNIDVTFRRDPQTGRPRINKPDSQKDTEQRQHGEFYYTE